MKFHKILAPLDGSRFAEAALPKAMELLSNNPDATLILLRAVEARTFPGVDPIDAQVSVVHEAEKYLETVAARLRKDGDSEVRTSVWYGAAAPAILEAARTARLVQHPPPGSSLGTVRAIAIIHYLLLVSPDLPERLGRGILWARRHETRSGGWRSSRSHGSWEPLP